VPLYQSPPPPSRSQRALCAGVFAIAVATLMYEVLLTRIFSVTMWYHFAFLTVAAALLGMTAGAILVQTSPLTLDAETAPRLLAVVALFFAVSVPATFVAHLAIPLTPTLTPMGLLSILLTDAVITVPFVFSGICVCLALTRSGGAVGTVYAADLAGAALGCLATTVALAITDAPAAVLGVAALAGVGAAAFAAAAGRRVLLAAAAATTVGALVVGAASPSWLRLVWVKGATEAGPTLYERWNSYSRVRVAGNPDIPSAPFGWGLSPAYPDTRRVSQLLLSIDAIADTVLTRFDGDLAAIDHLGYDVTNFAHYLRGDSSVMVVGAGGGRDVLAALAFRQRDVTAVEVNEAVLEALNNRFGEYTGHLDRMPSVRFVNDEARSYIARLDQRFDILQLSFIDTFAATAAGAYVLTEHSLYTVEAFRTFLDHLSPRGILTVSRWYFHENPAEIHRLVALATASLLEADVRQPREHLILVRSRRSVDPRYGEAIGVGTLLVGRRPFSEEDIARARAVARRLGFEIVLDPHEAMDARLRDLSAPGTFARAVAMSALDISPPTDDRPFFFYTVPLRRALRFQFTDQGNVSFNVAGILVLVGALGVVAVLTGACILVAVKSRGVKSDGDRARSTRRGSAVVFFAAIGLGYMLVEISQLQRLSVFLGHPMHALVVVLFALLLASGAGSFWVRREPAAGTRTAWVRPLLGLPLVLGLFGWLTPVATTNLRGLETPWRIAVAVALLAPIGFAMGMALPRGLQIATRRTSSGAPGLWAINGATSVLGSLVAVLVLISAGVSATFWTGAVAYGIAAVASLRMAGAAGMFTERP
jgi:hypothetical protein